MYIYLELDELQPPVQNHTKFHQSAVTDVMDLILQDGLLNPLTVKYGPKGYEILDGCKRYLAIRNLASNGRLPRSLNRIPCVMTNLEAVNDYQKLPQLTTHGELYDRIIDADRDGHCAANIAQRFDCDIEVVHLMKGLTSLHPEVLACFRRDHITFSQAVAFATLPNPRAQWNLLKRLGPFVREASIIAAIADGQTVLNLPNGECVILPSRRGRCSNINFKSIELSMAG